MDSTDQFLSILLALLKLQLDRLPQIEAKMADLATTLSQLKQAIADYGSDLQGVTQMISDLKSKIAGGQQISDADLTDLQSEVSSLQSGHQNFQTLLQQAPPPPPPAGAAATQPGQSYHKQP